MTPIAYVDKARLSRIACLSEPQPTLFWSIYATRTDYLHLIVLCEYMWLPVNIHEDISIPYVFVKKKHGLLHCWVMCMEPYESSVGNRKNERSLEISKNRLFVSNTS